MDRESLIRTGKSGAVHNYLAVSHDLPPIVLIQNSDEDVVTHVINENSGSKVRNKLEELLYIENAIDYVFVCRADATEFVSRARELNDVMALAPEDRIDVLVVAYLENGGEVESYYAELTPAEKNTGRSIGEWKEQNIEIMGNVLIRKW